MRNGIPAAGLSELAHEIREDAKQGIATYGVNVRWLSGSRAQVSTLPMTIGAHRVNRDFRWMVDEPRQLGGVNHAPNPQEYLLSGVGACIMVGFAVGPDGHWQRVNLGAGARQPPDVDAVCRDALFGVFTDFVSKFRKAGGGNAIAHRGSSELRDGGQTSGIASSAAPRSAIRSSGFSIPTERRTHPGSMPSRARCVAVNAA